MVSQISEINAPQEGIYEIYQLTYARDRRRRVHNNFMLLDMHDGPMPVDFIEKAWVILNYARASADYPALSMIADLSTAPKPSQ